MSEERGLPLREHIYRTEPVASPAIPSNGFSTNGLVEMLATGGQQFPALEPFFSLGVGNAIKQFKTTSRGAADVAGRAGIGASAQVRTMPKSLLLDLALLPGVTLDNVEGLTFGPVLADRSRTLILLSDNNFSDTRFTLFPAFRIIER